MLLVLPVVALPLALVSLPAFPAGRSILGDAGAGFFLGASAVALVLYAVNRRGRFALASRLGILALTCAVWYPLLTRADFALETTHGLVYFLPVPVFVAILLLDTAEGVALLGVNLSGVIALPALRPDADVPTAANGALLLFAFGAITLFAERRSRRDREERRRAESSVEARERELLEAQRIARLGSWTWDRETDRVTGSAELHRIFGLEGASFPSTFAGLLDRVHPEDRARVAQALGRAFRSQGGFELKHRILQPRAPDRVLHSRGRILRDPDGRVRSVLGTCHDVTEMEHVEAALRSSEKLSALGTLVAGVAHEINNPLTFMRGNLELNRLAIQDLLSDASLDASLREALVQAVANEAVVLNGVDRIAHITQSLRRVARVGAGARAPERIDVLVAGVLTLASPRLGDRVDVVHHSGSARCARVNGGEISQVLLNLVLNAADAMASLERGTLTVRSRDEGDRIVVEVEDTGPGIQPEDRHRIFTPFFTTKSHGTGLGLSVSHRIAEEHGGCLSFSNAPSGGACFRLELPAHGGGIDPPAGPAGPAAAASG